MAAPAEKASANVPSRVVHWRSIGPDVTQAELTALCAPFGAVQQVLLLRTKGQALVQMADLNSAVNLITYYSNVPASIRGRVVYAQYSSHQELTGESRNPSSAPSDEQGGPRGQQQEAPPNRILLVTISNPLYPITVDVLNQVFSPYGSIEKIVIFQKSAGLQALVQYSVLQSAVEAKNRLQGQNIYAGSCTLHIQFSNLQQLTVHHNTDKTRDFTNPNLPTEAPPRQQGGGGGQGSQGQNANAAAAAAAAAAAGVAGNTGLFNPVSASPQHVSAFLLTRVPAGGGAAEPAPGPAADSAGGLGRDQPAAHAAAAHGPDVQHGLNGPAGRQHRPAAHDVAPLRHRPLHPARVEPERREDRLRRPLQPLLQLRQHRPHQDPPQQARPRPDPDGRQPPVHLRAHLPQERHHVRPPDRRELLQVLVHPVRPRRLRPGHQHPRLHSLPSQSLRQERAEERSRPRAPSRRPSRRQHAVQAHLRAGPDAPPLQPRPVDHQGVYHGGVRALRQLRQPQVLRDEQPAAVPAAVLRDEPRRRRPLQHAQQAGGWPEHPCGLLQEHHLSSPPGAAPAAPRPLPPPLDPPLLVILAHLSRRLVTHSPPFVVRPRPRPRPRPRRVIVIIIQ